MSESELPLTFTEGRGRNVGLLAIAVVLAVGSLLSVTDDGPVWMWAGVVLFGLGIPLFAWSVFNPQKLVVDDDGVTATSPPSKKTHVPWDVVDHFKVNEINAPTGRAGRMVGFDFLDDAHRRRPDVVSGLLGQQMAQSVAGAHGAFPSTNCYGQDPDELIALLERVRVEKTNQ